MGAATTALLPLNGRETRNHEEATRILSVSEVDALQEENHQLKELVVQLSKIVIKSVIDRG
jgi:hypothetical protein